MPFSSPAAAGLRVDAAGAALLEYVVEKFDQDPLSRAMRERSAQCLT